MPSSQKSFPQTCLDIKHALIAAMPKADIQVIDNSWQHQSHPSAQAQPNKGHFHVIITDDTLKAQARLKSHKQVYASLGALMHKIHALQISIRGKTKSV